MNEQLSMDARQAKRKAAEAKLRDQLFDVEEEVVRLQGIDPIGIINELPKLKSLVGQLDHLAQEYRGLV